MVEISGRAFTVTIAITDQNMASQIGLERPIGELLCGQYCCLRYFTNEENMGLDKAINSGKEHRSPYYHSKRFDRSCRNHGGCPYCEGNRLHSSQQRDIASRDELQDMERTE